jgi:hypothetical protein
MDENSVVVPSLSLSHTHMRARAHAHTEHSLSHARVHTHTHTHTHTLHHTSSLCHDITNSTYLQLKIFRNVSTVLSNGPADNHISTAKWEHSNRNLVLGPKWDFTSRQTGRLTVGRDITMTLLKSAVSEPPRFSRCLLLLIEAVRWGTGTVRKPGVWERPPLEVGTKQRQWRRDSGQ